MEIQIQKQWKLDGLVATHGAWHVRVATCLCLTPHPSCILARGTPGMHEGLWKASRKPPRPPQNTKATKHTSFNSWICSGGLVELSCRSKSHTHQPSPRTEQPARPPNQRHTWHTNPWRLKSPTKTAQVAQSHSKVFQAWCQMRQNATSITGHIV